MKHDAETSEQLPDNESETATLLIVEDEAIIRKGLASLPWRENGISLLPPCCNSIQAEQTLRSERVDILLSDICMPGRSGLELGRLARARQPSIRLLYLTGYREFNFVKEALQLKASDYILKPADPKAIIEKVVRERDAVFAERKQKQPQQPQQQRQAAQPQNEAKPSLMGEILQYLQVHFAQPLNMNTLVEQFHFSAVHLSRYIKKETGYTFVELLTALRMHHAREYVRTSDLTNNQICEKVGICNEKYLAQLFKKQYGKTISQYRRGYGEYEEDEIAKLILRYTGKHI